MPTEANGDRRPAEKPIGRCARSIPPVLWELSSAPAPIAIAHALASGANWFFIPRSVKNADIAAMRSAAPDGGASIVLGVDAAAMTTRSTSALDQRLAALGGRATCDAILLQGVSLAEVKEGRTFHRVAQLRDGGRIELCFVEADSAADAEWMLRHTPAQGIALSFGIGDQTARYRILPEAAELATAIFARRPAKPIWPADETSRWSIRDDLSFIAAHQAITATIEPLPATAEDIDAVLGHLRNPMSDQEIERRWNAFRQHVTEPPKPRSAHPPDWA